MDNEQQARLNALMGPGDQEYFGELGRLLEKRALGTVLYDGDEFLLREWDREPSPYMEDPSGRCILLRLRCNYRGYDVAPPRHQRAAAYVLLGPDRRWYTEINIPRHTGTAYCMLPECIEEMSRLLQWLTARTSPG